MMDGELYDTLKNKRADGKKAQLLEPTWDWRKLIPSESKTSPVCKQSVTVSHVPTRKKANPLDVVGKREQT